MAIVWADRIQVVEGDITALDVDVIVNAANQTLLGGGGVDGAIHRAAGPGLLAECRRKGGCPTGSALLTRGHGLCAQYVVHAVGPVYHSGRKGEADLLRLVLSAVARAGRRKTRRIDCFSLHLHGCLPISQAGGVPDRNRRGDRLAERT